MRAKNLRNMKYTEFELKSFKNDKSISSKSIKENKKVI